MDQRDIRTLKILEELEQDHIPSQRDLARKLNISLGLVNSFIKRLAHKGYFKVTNIPANRVRYLLTPKGFAEKSRLAMEYMRYSLKFYGDMRETLRSTFGRMVDEGVTKVMFYGTGEVAELAYLFLQETTLELTGVVSDKQDKARFFDLPVRLPKDLERMGEGAVLLTELEDPERIKAVLANIGGNNRKLYSLIGD